MTQEQIQANIRHNTGQDLPVDFSNPIMQFSQNKWKTEWVENSKKWLAEKQVKLEKTAKRVKPASPKMSRGDMMRFIASRK